MNSLDQERHSKYVADQGGVQFVPPTALSVSNLDAAPSESIDSRIQSASLKRMRSDESVENEGTPLAKRVQRPHRENTHKQDKAVLGAAIDSIEERLRFEFNKISDRQGEVSKLHGLIETLNNAAKEGGSVELSTEELADFQKRAAELGVKLPKLDTKITKEQKDSVIQNINMRVDDLGTLTQKDFFKLQTLNQRKMQLWELLSSMEKMHHDIIMSIARKIGG